MNRNNDIDILQGRGIMIKLFIVFVALFYAVSSFAVLQDGEDDLDYDYPAVASDLSTTKEKVYIPDESTIKVLKEKPEYDYFYTKEKKEIKPVTPPKDINPDPSFLNKIFSFLADIVLSIVKFAEVLGTFVVSIKWIILILLAGIIIFLVLKYTNLKDVFSKKTKVKYDLKFTEISATEQEIREVKDQHIIDAIDNEDYRLATRYCFLKMLKLLSDKELIRWKEYKTNSDYIAELKNVNLKESYHYVGRIFEYVWYGEFSLSKDDFLMVYDRFNEIYKTIEDDAKQ